jgi:choline dehydrogenase-like flavoprotein
MGHSVEHRQPSQIPNTCYVVGSGPAGIACAQALLDRGRTVQLLDAGITLEKERLAVVENLRKLPPEDWGAAELAEYQAGMNPDVGGVPLKLVYGSDFAYRDADQHLGTDYHYVGLRPSFAQGGLSNVWGAAMLPYLDQDIRAWPFGTNVLAPHYESALRITGLAACEDSLADLFPLYTNQFTELRPSRQAQQLLDRMQRNSRRLSEAGIYFGRSRLAVRGRPSGEAGGCVYCRLCMYGCPYGHIYCSSDTLKRLQEQPRFTYRSGIVVKSVNENGSGVTISGYDRTTRAPLLWHGKRVFLAAGAIPTTAILLRSLACHGRTAWLKDSQYFLIPLVLRRRVPGAMREQLHSLSQVFLEMTATQGDDRTVHVQIYSHSDLIGQAVIKSFRGLATPLGFLARNVQERLLVAQGFLHSDHSAKIAVMLDGQDRLQLKADLSADTKPFIRKVVKKLLRHAWQMGALPLPILLKTAEPGRSFHAGGSFPMALDPHGFETDLLGRVPGWQRIHSVDATIFPSIPGTTITLSVMANAHRIGWEAASLDS